MTISKFLSSHDLPLDWDGIRLRWLAKCYTGGTPDTKKSDYWEGGTIPWLNSGAVNQGTITVPSDFITELALKNSSAKWIPAGSLVIALAGQGKTKATVGFLEISSTGNQSLAAIVPKKVEGKYLYWWLSSQYLTLRNLASQDGRDGLNLEMIGSIVCPVPPSETQRRIAIFLNEKTERIDRLIEKKRNLLERLAENRQILITNAVTKGLNPGTPLKPSGIDWLGDIPAHWEVVPFKWRCRVQSGQVDPLEPEYAKLPLVAPDHIESGTGRLFGVTSAEEQGAISGKYLCPPGSVLYSKIRPALRKAAIFGVKCLCSADMYAIDPGSHFERDYLFYFLLTDTFTAYAELESLRVAMPKINRDALGAFPLPVPNLIEQREIASYCAEVDAKHQNAGDQILSSIKMLEEYRSALVTSAVTGQITSLL